MMVVSGAIDVGVYDKMAVIKRIGGSVRVLEGIKK